MKAPHYVIRPSKRDRPGQRQRRRLATWGRVYDNEDLARKAKQMEKQVARLKDEQTELSVGPPWRLVLQGDALPADRLLEMDRLPVAPAGTAGPVPPAWRAAQRIAWPSWGATAAVNRPAAPAVAADERRIASSGAAPASPAHPGYYDQTLAQLPDDASLLDALTPFAPSADARNGR
jgi:AraC-like DNA-binding protein